MKNEKKKPKQNKVQMIEHNKRRKNTNKNEF